MNQSKRYITFFALAGLLFSALAAAQSERPPPLPIEPTGRVKTLPERYPAHWFLVHDAAFFHMLDGKALVVDATAESAPEQYKGSLGSSLMGHVHESATRPEIYVIETFHSRGTRGKRSDVLSIWDKATLKPVAEVMWPRPGRLMSMPERYAMQTIDGGRLLLVSNFTPATSVTVVDLDRRAILNEVATPGCVLVYPTGPRGFSSLCSDGRFMSVQLSAAGKLLMQTRGDIFFNSDDAPIFERAARIDDVAYFPSFHGLVHPVDLSGKTARPGAPWSLVSRQERAQNWRPGGIAIIDEDDLGRFYVLMHPAGADGSQGGGGPEVWVFDPRKQRRVQRIVLQEWGLSLALSRGPQPLLMVTNPTDMSLEIYDARTGKFQRKLVDLGLETPLISFGARQE